MPNLAAWLLGLCAAWLGLSALAIVALVVKFVREERARKRREAVSLAPYIADVEAAIVQALELGVETEMADLVLWECELRESR